jgi:hypothetical protein
MGGFFKKKYRLEKLKKRVLCHPDNYRESYSPMVQNY